MTVWQVLHLAYTGTYICSQEHSVGLHVSAGATGWCIMSLRGLMRWLM